MTYKNVLVKVQDHKWDDFKLLCGIYKSTVPEQIDLFLDEMIEKHSKILKGVKDVREKK